MRRTSTVSSLLKGEATRSFEPLTCAKDPDIPALGMLNAMAELNIALVEQPTPDGDYAGLARVRRETGRKVMADDICFINSIHGDHNDHFQATLGIHTGSVTFKRPSIGSWVSYGLGTENQNLPSFVVLAPQLPYTGGQVWDSDFLPAVHQGVRVVAGDRNDSRTGRKPFFNDRSPGRIDRRARSG